MWFMFYNNLVFLKPLEFEPNLCRIDDKDRPILYRPIFYSPILYRPYLDQISTIIILRSDRHRQVRSNKQWSNSSQQSVTSPLFSQKKKLNFFTKLVQNGLKCICDSVVTNYSNYLNIRIVRIIRDNTVTNAF